MLYIKRLVLVCIAISLTACASGSHVLTGTKRPAISPEAVTVYTTAPEQDYEVVASVEASSSRGVSQQGRMDSAIEALKVEAAEIGANGVIVGSAPNGTGGVSTHIATGISGGSRGFRSGIGTGFTINPAQVRGIAIFVSDLPKN